MSFVHTHVHFTYSLLDGAGEIDDIVKRAAEMGQPAVAVTDHGVMYGAIDLYEAARAEGIKPLIGMEGYMAVRTRYDREAVDRKPYHFLTLAKDFQGYRNLMKLSTEAQRNFYYRPRLDRTMLELPLGDNLIVTSGCLAAEIPQAIMRGDNKAAWDAIRWHRDRWGDDFYLEVQYRQKSPDQEAVNKWLLDYSRRSGVKVVVTSDAHYVRASDAYTHDLMLCIQTGARQSDQDRMRFDEDTYYLVDTQTLQRVFSARPDVLDNTLEIAEKCNIQMPGKQYHLPEYPVPEGYTPEQYLRMLCEIGLEWRFGERKGEPEVQNRLQFELETIEKIGFSTYFLIVWDLTQFARIKDIWFNVRGSGAGSIVAYCLGITGIDPLEHHLLFERFLNPERVNMPDLDLDFQDDRRPEVIQYLKARYGEDRTSPIITFGTIGPKAAVRDVGRVLNYPLPLVNQVSAAIPAKAKTLELALEESADLQKLAQDAGVAALLKSASPMVGKTRQASTHAAGILIADQPLVEYIPLCRPPKTKGQDASEDAISQYPMHTVDDLGLLKVDILGLRTLTIMRKACALIEQRHGHHWTIDNIPYRHTADQEANDLLNAAFTLLQRGETLGVFQVESPGMVGTLRDMKPTSFEHIVATVALYRPGPMDFIPLFNRRLNGLEPIEYPHPALEPILKETMGICIYQEQVMQIFHDLFGYSKGKADLVRKDIAKKTGKLQQHKETLLRIAPTMGFTLDEIEAIWAFIEKFADYGFNKGHASDYAKLTVQTAFLKAHYPYEFMLANLQAIAGDTERMSELLTESKRLGIRIEAPDINRSGLEFTLDENEPVIRFGLNAVKGVNAASIKLILEWRKQNQGKVIKTVNDLIHMLPVHKINSLTLNHLIQAGAFSEIAEKDRLLHCVDVLRSWSKKAHQSLKSGGGGRKQYSLFDEDEGDTYEVSLVELMTEAGEFTPLPERALLDMERDLLGFYITARPVDRYVPQFDQKGCGDFSFVQQYPEEWDGVKTRAGGEVLSVRTIFDSKGREMAFVDFQDYHASGTVLSLTFFSKVWAVYRKIITPGAMLVIYGKVDFSRGKMNLLVDDVFPLKTDS